MARYIELDALVAEIERLRKSFKVISVASPSRDTTLENIAKAALCRQILSFIDTLEVKEVDLEKEIQDHIKECLDVKFPTTDIELIKKDVAYTARRFFELGLKKGQKNIWHDSNEEQPNFASDVAIWNPKYKNGEIISRCTQVYSDRIWAYIDDLLKI